jgi:acyl-CoA oxidase
LNLYAKTIINLGTSKHRKYIEDAFNFNDIGCFGLTELGHGSNTRDLLTTADYNHITREFILNTNQDIGMKFWIGAAAHLANMAVIWAQLCIDGKSYGIHAFLVPIRNKSDHSLLPGIIIGDCGLKTGWNIVDNGFIVLKNVKAPYDALLDRLSGIDAQGCF